ncbi:hypothetical protein [Microbacterium sp. NPDC089696]|uniref:hypothetical protein n=1 Tax=Microbacterium sp. NPDC089696 TaxID=3364199 RepID=UPI00380E8816
MTTPTIRDRVFNSIPGYDDAKRVLANRLSVSLPPRFDVKNARGAVFGKVHAAIRDGEPIPEEVTEELAAIDRAQENDRAVALLVDEVVRAAETTRDMSLPADQDEPYMILDDELQKLVKRVQSVVPALDGAVTSGEAIANGTAAVDAWRNLAALVGDYDEIRTVQFEIMPRDLNFWDRLTTTGLYKDALAVHPFFAEKLARNDRHPDSSTAPASLLPLSGEQSWWPGDVDRPTALLRIVTTATPWVPTPTVMAELYTRASAAVARINLDDPREERQRRIAAHDDYLAWL